MRERGIVPGVNEVGLGGRGPYSHHSVKGAAHHLWEGNFEVCGEGKCTTHLSGCSRS